MDVLCLPREPYPLPDKTPYVSKETPWDGGKFKKYAIRKDKIGIIPRRLRTGGLESDASYLEGIFPTPKEELEAFYQTWFFFGLLAEFFGLNEQENGEPVVEVSLVKKELDSLYAECCYDEASRTYVSGSIVLKNGLLLIQRLRESKIGLEARMAYLFGCLRFTSGMLNSVPIDFDQSIKYSIAALGEIFSTAMNTYLRLRKPDFRLSPQDVTWSQGYIQPGGRIEDIMDRNGWCKSDVERIRSIGGLNTVHFLSRLKRPIAANGHSDCTKRSCSAFHSNKEKYVPKHAVKGCQCQKIKVDLKSVFHILETTDSYPVLQLKLSEDLENVEMSVEAYVPHIPYIALSHVWADGLGDYYENALHLCQIRNLAQIIAQLPKAVETGGGSSIEQISYRLWIDTLCCPVEEERKKIALARITNVYRNATHVLVLDSSLSSYKAINADPAEILLRTFYTSPWMRRLWTLQEGVLARTLYFQFADGPIKALDKMKELIMIGMRDARYMRMYLDLNIEMTLLQAFKEIGTPQNRSIAVVQQSLHFRSVTDPFDETLCLATLLSLDISDVYGVKLAAREAQSAAREPQDAAKVTQDAMACVWKLLARPNGGGIPARIIFFVDNPIDKVGWRWAPRSLLESRPDSCITLFHKVQRFSSGDGAEPSKMGVPEYLGDPESLGVPESLGLRVQFPGLRLQVRPRVDGILHPWNGMLEPCEDYILVWNSETKKWFRILDSLRTHKVMPLPVLERAAYDREANNPLCTAIDKGDCALIRDNGLASDEIHCLLVQIIVPEGEKPSGPEQMQPLRVRSLRQVIIKELNSAEVLVAETGLKIAKEVAKEEITTLEQVRLRMEKLTAENWEANEDFRQAVHDTLGESKEKVVWKTVPKLFSHDIHAVNFAEDQVWIVD